MTEISNVKCVTRLPKETKRQAVAIIFTDDSARTFTCDSGEAPGRSLHLVFWTGRGQWFGQEAEQGQPWLERGGGGGVPEGQVDRRVAWPCPPCLAGWGN